MKLLPCKECGSEAEESFIDCCDSHITVLASIECLVCDNESETFTRPADQSMGDAEMGSLIEQLARLHWNIINK